MSGRFADKIALITGAASGIGLETARLMLREGARVVLADLNQAAFDELAGEFAPAVALCQIADVARFEDVQALVDSAVAHFGGLDILVNNAGIGSDLARVPELSVETWRRVIAVDLDSVFHGCKAAIPEMRRRGGGAIVNTASISGLAGDYGFNAYNAAKGAVINFTRALAIDHAPENIRVNALCPGFIDTSLTAFADEMGLREAWMRGIPMRRAGTAAEMAKVVAFLASDDASYMTGSIVVADGGVMAATGQPDLYAAAAAISPVLNAGGEQA